MSMPRKRQRFSDRSRRAFLQVGLPWAAALLVGLVSVVYAQLSNEASNAFLRAIAPRPWLAFIITPAMTVLALFLTQRWFTGTEGSGIPQVIAALRALRAEEEDTLLRRLFGLRVVIGKIAVSLIGLLGGLTIGREGPTVHIGAAIMAEGRRFYPHRSAPLERRLLLAGAAAGLSAAFNTPLAGIVFAIEELTRSFEARASGVLITAIIIAGVIALGLNGNYTYFGTIQIGVHFPDLLALAVLLTAVVTGIAGGVFGWLLLNTARWIPAPLRQLHGERPVVFAALCGLAIAVVGLI